MTFFLDEPKKKMATHEIRRDKKENGKMSL